MSVSQILGSPAVEVAAGTTCSAPIRSIIHPWKVRVKVVEVDVTDLVSEATGAAISPIRIGQGFDVHPYASGSTKPLVLAGVRFDGEPGLRGHSDADVIAHACIDALLGAAGLGDIGSLFPDTDERWAGSDSVAMLADAADRLEAAGWAVVNVDCTVILDRPKIAPHRATMSENLSRAVGAPVSIKGKRTEGVAGLGGGVQCHAVALLQRHETEGNR